jgi:hypothetical protein
MVLLMEVEKVDPTRALSVQVVQRWAAGINAVGGDVECEKALIHHSLLTNTFTANAAAVTKPRCPGSA